VTPRVSVVIVSYRSRAVLPVCLESLASCAARVPLEVVVVDNASRDGTVEWLDGERPRVRVIANAGNRGFTRGVNQGLAAARGEALLVLNPDARIGPAALERLLEALGEPGLAAVAPMLVDDQGRPVRSCGRFPSLWTLACEHLGPARLFPEHPWFAWYKYGGRPLESLERVDWCSGAALLLRRDAYRRLGGLDEGIFMYMEEVDWCRRARAAGLGVRYVPAARVTHSGQHASRQVREASYLHNLRSRVYYFRKHHGAPAAAGARAILSLGLILRWLAARLRIGRAGEPGVYARGLQAVWAC
jgi:hypothetical protein